MEFQFTCDNAGVRLIKRCVDLYIERWPGGNPEEQQMLHQLQTTLAAMVLETMIDDL
jgi:hypothetical protein